MDSPQSHQRVTFAEAARVWARVAALSFGGPAGQIAVMHRILVEEKRWIDEQRFLHALNYCMLLPGPEAQQLATYIGWLLHRTAGGLFAGGLFVLPGFLSILMLSLLYVSFHDARPVMGLFFGLKAAVLALVVEAVLRIARRALRNRAMVLVAAVAFLAIFVFELPFPLLVFCAAALGMAGARAWPDVFLFGGGQGAREDTAVVGPDPIAPTIGRALRIAILGVALWFGPLLMLAAVLGSDHVLVHEGILFSKAAVVTFGGAYSVLAYIAQQAVEVHGWLRPGEMLDGLGMAETTPGPLIQVVQFVGFLGAYRNPEPFSPLTAAVFGSLVTTWVTYVPCFLWILLGAPYIERLRRNVLLSSGLSAVTAAVVGVVLNLAIWFGLHVAFRTVTEMHVLGARILLPDVWSANPGAIAIAAIAFVATFRWHWGMIATLAVSCALGLLWQLVVA